MGMKLNLSLLNFRLSSFLLFVSCSVVAQNANPPAGIQVEKLIQNTTSWNGSDLPDYPKGEAEVTILRITIPPHTALPLHKHPVINAGVLLEGELTVVTPEGLVKHMKAGDPLIELVEQWHFGKNEGDEPAVILVVYAGEKGKPFTVLHPNPESVLKE